MEEQRSQKTNLGGFGLTGALVVGFFVFACCIGPLVMVLFGISSAGAVYAAY